MESNYECNWESREKMMSKRPSLPWESRRHRLINSQRSIKEIKRAKTFLNVKYEKGLS